MTRRIRTYILLDKSPGNGVKFALVMTETHSEPTKRGFLLCKHPLIGRLLSVGGDIMPEKRSPPLENPPQEKADNDGYYHCRFCQYETKSTGAYRMHISRFHEVDVVEEGVKSPREGGDKWERNRQYLLAHGYVKCPWWTVPCPTRINPLMARVCKHLNDCPERR